MTRSAFVIKSTQAAADGSVSVSWVGRDGSFARAKIYGRRNEATSASRHNYRSPGEQLEVVELRVSLQE